MNINTIPGRSKYKNSDVQTLAKPSGITDNVFDVPWGYYLASQGKIIKNRVMTSSLASCFAYFFWDTKKHNFFFAHVSCDSEAESVIRLVKELSGGDYSMFATHFVCVTGKNPQDTTARRINSIIEGLGQRHRLCRATEGEVTFDLSQATVIQTNSVAKTQLTSDDTKKAMNDSESALRGMQIQNSWVR